MDTKLEETVRLLTRGAKYIFISNAKLLKLETGWNQPNFLVVLNKKDHQFMCDLFYAMVQQLGKSSSEITCKPNTGNWRRNVIEFCNEFMEEFAQYSLGIRKDFSVKLLKFPRTQIGVLKTIQKSCVWYRVFQLIDQIRKEGVSTFAKAFIKSEGTPGRYAQTSVADYTRHPTDTILKDGTKISAPSSYFDARNSSSEDWDSYYARIAFTRFPIS